MKKRTIALLMAAVMLFGVVVGGTVAWLQASTSTVTNTFEVGNIRIKLDEQDWDDSTADAHRDYANKYPIIPGTTYVKDPTVVVLGGSEECYLFVKFEEIGDPSEYYTYESLLTENNDNGWTKLENIEGVWYRVVPSSTEDKPFCLLAGNDTYANGYITIKDTVEQDDMASASAASLKWTAYAVQTANMDINNNNMNDDASYAWTAAGFGTNTTTDAE